MNQYNDQHWFNYNLDSRFIECKENDFGKTIITSSDITSFIIRAIKGLHPSDYECVSLELYTGEISAATTITINIVEGDSIEITSNGIIIYYKYPERNNRIQRDYICHHVF